MSTRILTVAIESEPDVVLARQRARQIAAELGFDATDQTRLATAVSEIARNAYVYAGGGRVEFQVEGEAPPQVLVVQVIDRGKGIADLDRVLSGRYESRTGLGLGVVGAKRLVDSLDVTTSGTGTVVTLKKLLPRRAPTLDDRTVGLLAQRLAQKRPATTTEEVQLQNQELLRTLDELRARQEELLRVNRELEDTNRGVVALYAELDERADHLRRADELKSRFLSNMTHEFRTPVNSILALTELMGDRLGTTVSDSRDELFYIRKSAQQLAELVDDLLDLAKVEAGKTTVRPAPFDVNGLFGALRGMLRPLMVQTSVALVFEDASSLPAVLNDETKVSQILRNFISNALKYTERGEVRVSAHLSPGGDAVVFEVADTGVGLAEKDLTRIFDEFVQVENPLQRRVKGTGLGLPLARRLAELLGGSVSVTSLTGAGSTFMATIPLICPTDLPVDSAETELDPSERPVLVITDHPSDTLLGTLDGLTEAQPRRLLLVDDEEGSRFVTRHLLPSGLEVLEACSAIDGLKLAMEEHPDAVVLDLLMPELSGYEVLERMRADARTQEVPVIILSSLDPSGDDRRRLDTASAILNKRKLTREALADAVSIAFAHRHAGRQS